MNRTRVTPEWQVGLRVRDLNTLERELGSRVVEYIMNENYRVPYRYIPWPKSGTCRWYMCS